MIIIGLGVGFVVGLIALSLYLFTIGSGWYHQRYHAVAEGERPSVTHALDCDRCMKLWRDEGAPRG